MFGVFYCVVKPDNYAQGVRQPVSVRVGCVRREAERIEGRRAVSACFVSRHQGGAVHGRAASVRDVEPVG